MTSPSSAVGWADGEYVTEIDLRFRDWDINGHLSHLAYIELAEIARISHMRAAGIAPEHLVTHQRGLILLDLQVRYLNEVRAGIDRLEFVNSAAPMGRKTVRYRQTLRHDGRALCEVEITMGLLDLLVRRLRPDPIAELADLAARIAQHSSETSDRQTRNEHGDRG